MWSRRTVLVASGLTLVRGSATGQSGTAPGRDALGANQVSLEISDYPLLFAPVRINGTPVQALIDTGSSSPVRLSARLAQALGLVLVTDARSAVQALDGRRLAVQRTAVDTLAVGDWVESNFEVEVAGNRIESISAQVGTSFDAILGWDFLSRRNFMVDYRRRVLRFGESPQQPAPKSVPIAYTVVNRLPVVAGLWDQRPLKLLLDTGAPMCNIDTLFAGVPTGEIVLKDLILGSMNLPIQWRVKDLTVTRQALGSAGTLGNNLLRQYAVFVDVRNRLIYLEP